MSLLSNNMKEGVYLVKNIEHVTEALVAVYSDESREFTIVSKLLEDHGKLIYAKAGFSIEIIPKNIEDISLVSCFGNKNHSVSVRKVTNLDEIKGEQPF